MGEIIEAQDVFWKRRVQQLRTRYLFGNISEEYFLKKMEELGFDPKELVEEDEKI